MRVLVPILLIFLSLTGCDRQPEAAALQGYVEGEFVYMAPPAGGILQTLEVKEGDAVSSGQLLFTMDAVRERAALAEARMKLAQGRALAEDARQGQRPTEIAALEAQLKQAQAALDLSLKTLERQRVLFRDKVIPAEEFDRARSDARQKQQAVSEVQNQIATAQLGQRTYQVEAAEANVRALEAAQRQAQWNLDQTTQTAPQAAAVFDVFFRPGEVVPAGRPVVSLLPPANVRVRAFVPQAKIGSVVLGTSATVTIDGVAEPAMGSVTFISPKAEFTPPVIYSQQMRQKLSFLVEISFPAEVARTLHPGQPVDVYLQGAGK